MHALDGSGAVHIGNGAGNLNFCNAFGKLYLEFIGIAGVHHRKGELVAVVNVALERTERSAGHGLERAVVDLDVESGNLFAVVGSNLDGDLGADHNLAVFDGLAGHFGGDNAAGKRLGQRDGAVEAFGLISVVAVGGVQSCAADNIDAGIEAYRIGARKNGIYKGRRLGRKVVNRSAGEYLGLSCGNARNRYGIGIHAYDLLEQKEAVGGSYNHKFKLVAFFLPNIA